MKVQRTSSNNERQDIEYGAQIEVEGTTTDRYENKYWSRVESLTTDIISPPAKEQQTKIMLTFGVVGAIVAIVDATIR